MSLQIRTLVLTDVPAINVREIKRSPSVFVFIKVEFAGADGLPLCRLVSCV